jgi:CheY-like chemotaxis protein
VTFISSFEVVGRLAVRLLNQIRVGPWKFGKCLLSVFRSPRYDQISIEKHEAWRVASQITEPAFKPSISTGYQPLPTLSALDAAIPALNLVVRDKPEQVQKEADNEDLAGRPFLLLVEDNAINMRILVTSVKKLNHQYSTAEDGHLAVENYKQAARKPDIILMDISMPIMDGFCATRHIRKYEAENELPASTIVAVTGLASDSAQREAYSSGINLFLSKPVPLRDLKKVLLEWKSNMDNTLE